MEGESFDDAPSIAQLDGCSSVWCATTIIETPGYVYRLHTYSDDDDQDSARRLEASDDPPFRRRRASSGSTDASRAKKYAAKLLEQTTFGPTTAEIARLSTGLQHAANGVSGTAREDAYAGVAREWVHEQMQENATSLRAYVRRRSQKRVLPGQNLISGVELPSTEPWESMWQPIAQWMGVAPCDLPKVMPHLRNFPVAGEGRVLRAEDVYEARAV
mmetsp:Transcript_30404/g.89577  ORF Transcript_30404/g.89577 Transcript_30404/m.89577 type:complete len:216 (+) Transcript_30404:329-976(+)